MLTSSVALPVDDRQTLATLLNALLASCLDLHSQVKHAHWNVKGPSFRALHELFEELATRLSGHADELAERSSALGGRVRGTVRQTAENTQIGEYDLDALDGMVHLRALVRQFAAFDARLRDGIELAENSGDPVTVDLLTQTAAAVEKDLWLVESHLNV